MSANCIEKNSPKHTKTIRNDHHGAQDAQLSAVKPRRVGDHGAGDGPYLWRRAGRVNRLTINTWSDETTGKKGGPGRLRFRAFYPLVYVAFARFGA